VPRASKSSPPLAKPQAEKRFKLSEAEAEAEALLNYLRSTRRDQMAVTGSYRQRRDTVGDLDIVVAARNGAAMGDKLTNYENVANILAHGRPERRSSSAPAFKSICTSFPRRATGRR
jgi:DNA polymerase (family 10)